MEVQNHAAKTNLLKRRLTKFVCQELLFDYQIGRLDEERKNAVEEFLKESRECQEQLKHIRAGIDYCQQLTKITIESSYIDGFVLQPVPWWRRLLYIFHWSYWPQPARWALEATVFSAFVMAIVYYTPWNKLSQLDWKRSQDVAVVEFSNNMEGAEPAEDTESEVAENDNTDVHEEGEMPDDVGTKPSASAKAIDNVSDEAPPTKSTPPPPAVAAAVTPPPPKAVAQVSPPPKVETKPSTPVPTPTQASLPATTVAVASKTAPAVSPAPTPTTNQPTTVPADQVKIPGETNEKVSKTAQGLLYRLIMTIPDVETVGPQITAKIEELGGKKAGNVELGWKKDNGRYYHFSFPEVNEQAFLTYLQGLGPVRISKVKHERVMPAGQLRFILWVEPKGN